MIDVDVDTALAELGAIVARIRDPNALLMAIGERETELAQQRIEDIKADPFDVAWLPWADSTEHQRERKGNIALGLLYDTGALLESIHFEVASETVSIGSDADYAIYLQEGTSKMPARPFLGWTPEGFELYEGWMVAFLQTGVPA